MKQILIFVFLPIYTNQISSTLKDPFEYFQKLTRDTQIYPQCDLIPPFKTQLDSSFFDNDLRQWQRKKNPPPIHRTLEAFVQLDTLRQSTYFSHILQGNSQAKVPGILYFYLSAAAQLHTLKQLSLINGKSLDTVQTVRYAFDSNEVFRVPWYKIGGSFMNFERPFSIYAFSTESPLHLSIIDSGVGSFSKNDYTLRFFEHFNTVYNNPLKTFRNYDEYFNALIQTWSTRTRSDQDDLADWGKETKEYNDLLQYKNYFPLPYRSVPKPDRTDMTDKQSEFNPVFPYADLVYDYYRDPNYYRYARGWFLNYTQAESNQYMLNYGILPDRIQRNVLLPMFEQNRWTGPYIYCPLNSNEWLVSSIQPIWATNHFNYKNSIAFQNNRRYNYAGVTNVELAYTQLDVNQCPGNHLRNVYANSAACDRNAFCDPIAGFNLQSGGYQCSCHPNFRYPSNVRTPYRPAFDKYSSKSVPHCQPVRLLTQYPTWQVEQTKHYQYRRSVPRPNLFEKLRSLIFNRPSTCPPWSHIAMLPVEQNDDDNIRFVNDLTRHVDRIARPFTLQAVRLAHLFSSYLALYRPDRDPANDGFLDRRSDPPLTEQWLESEIMSTGLAYTQLLECDPIAGFNLQSGGYQCSCHPNFRYPSNVRTPYRPAFDKYSSKSVPHCQPVRLLTQYPTWQVEQTKHYQYRRSVPRPNLFEKLRSLIFNRPSTCPPWSHIAMLPVEQNDDDNIRFVNDLTRHVDRIARPFTLQAVRLAHLFSSYLALYRPDRDPANDGFLDRRSDPPLTEQWLESEIMSTGLAYTQLLEVGIYLNGSEYERQNPFQQRGEPLEGQNEFGYRTSVFQHMNYGLAFIRFDNEDEKYILNRTLDGSYLNEGGWYDKALQMRANIEKQRYSVSMTMRRDILGTQLIKLPTLLYDAPTTGVWFGPYHDCSFPNPSSKSMVRWRYSVPIFKEIARLPVGFVSIVFGSDLRWYSINPCDDTIGVNVYNPFQSLHKCHRETTECQQQTIPEEETGFDLASYRCVCKTGHEYPFGSMKNYFEGAIIEREYAKMLRGEINALLMIFYRER
ncbi:unnamed protein product [Adineta steineri]|uniref:GPR158/179 extracellular domain-containing protein n=1 Tax=Adineta steineri TaxID=433720 RepID=A0A815CYJ4_9BILA|nr:unnamed protein product [Adineta steineri]